MDSETVPRQIGYRHTHLIYSKGRIPLLQTPKLSPKCPTLCQSVCCWFTSTCFAFGLAPYRSTEEKSQHGQLSPGQASFPHRSRSTWPCAHLPNHDWRVLRLQSGWLSETIRPGDSSGSLPLFSMPHPI